MALRLKTQEYCFDGNRSSLAAATRFDFSALTLALENQSRTFRKVAVVVHIEDADTTAVNMTSILIGIKLGAVAFSDGTTSATMTNSAQQQSLEFSRDVTSYFTTNYGSLVEQTCQVGVQVAAKVTINISVKLVVTYEFDDTELLNSGTASAGAASTLTDSSKSFTTDLYKGHYIKITGGTGSGQVKRITANTGTVVTVDGTWSTNPDATSTYQILQGKIKTVKIPLESNSSSLTTTLASIGSTQIPNLDTFLPEANKHYRNICFEIFGKDNNNGTTDFTLAFALDAEAEVNTGNYEYALNGGLWRYHLWKRDDLVTSSTHDFKARSNAVATRHFGLCVILNVTYAYLESESSTVMNSVMLPIDDPDLWVGGTAVGNRDRVTREFWIEEPATITLRQSALVAMFGHSGAHTLQLAMGGQSSRSYAVPAANVEVGQSSVMQRIDSGGAQGAGVTIARGKNTFQLDVYSSSGLDHSMSAYYLILNYTSGKAAGGVETHNKTIQTFGGQGTTTSNRFTFSAFAPVIPEASYFLNSVYFYVIGDHNVGGASGRILQTLRAERQASDTPAEGWEQIGVGVINTDTEMGVFHFIFTALDKFKRWAGDPSSKMDVETTRQYYLESWTTYLPMMFMNITYHSITRTVAGNVRGYTGTGSGITVGLHRSDTGELVATTTTGAGGSFSFTWYDDTIDVYVEAQQDDDHVGRSSNAVAV